MLNIVNFKENILNSKKYIILYLVLIGIFAISIFNIENYMHPKFEILTVGLITIIGLFIIIFYQSHKSDTELWKTAFVIVLLFGLLCCFLMPFVGVSDEGEHFTRSEITSTGQLFPQYVNGKYITIQAYGDLFDNMTVEKDDSYNVLGVKNGTIFTTNALNTPINYSAYKTSNAFAQNPFYGYLAQAIGMDIAKFLDLSVVWLLWFGRICNLLVYATFVALAVKKSPILKIPLIVMACIPFAMYQASSLSIDAFINGLSLFIIAYFFYMYKSPKKSLTKRHLLIFSGLCVILGFAKISLFIFCLLLLFVPKDNYADKKFYYFSIISIVLVFILAYIWISTIAQGGFFNSTRNNYSIKNNVSVSGQISFLLNHPRTSLVRIPHYIKHLDHNLTFNANRMNFNKLNTIYLMFLGSVVFLYPMEKFKLKSKIGSFLVIAAIYFETYIMFLLSWTPVGSLTTRGVQIRYFLPLYSLLPFTFGFNHMDGNKDEIDSMIILLTISFLALMLISLIQFFY